jgi:hypothetical protein
MRGISRLEDANQLDRTVAVGQRIARWIRSGKVRDALHGVWLGYPLHPLLVQLPAGMWLSASALDLLAPRADPAARRLAAARLATVSAIVAGAVDWSEQHEQQMRVGLVHALASSSIQGMRRWRTARSNSTGRVRVADSNATHARQLPRSRSPSGLENFPEPAELVTETAGVKAELRQQIGVLAIIGVHLVRELLAGLLSLVVVALALQQLHNLVFANVHELSFPSNW